MMKNPFSKVCGLGLFKHGKRHRQAIELSVAQLEELSQASQDMQDMRDCYDRLHSAAAGTMNTTHAFSESLLEIGDCLLQRSALSDDEDSGRVLQMLGMMQFKIQELIQNYHSHLNETITAPSKSLLSRLRIVEDMKIQCDEKRSTFEALKNSNGHVSSHELQSARDEFNENATLFIFCMKSLKRGQSRSLVTQATRHCAAQMRFFRKAFKTLESIEPHVKLTTELHHIDYCRIMRDKDEDKDTIFVNDDEKEENNDEDNDAYYDTLKDDELINIDTHMNARKNEASTSRNIEEFMYRRPFTNSTTVGISKSTPISVDPTFDPNKTYRQMRQSSTRKLNTYNLPTPNTTHKKILVTSGIESQPRPPTNNMRHSTQERFSYIGSTSHGPHIPKLTRAFSTPQPQASTSLTVTGFPLRIVSELHQLPRPPATKKPPKLGFSLTFKRGPDLPNNTGTSRP